MRLPRQDLVTPMPARCRDTSGISANASFTSINRKSREGRAGLSLIIQLLLSDALAFRYCADRRSDASPNWDWAGGVTTSVVGMVLSRDPNPYRSHAGIFIGAPANLRWPWLRIDMGSSGAAIVALNEGQLFTSVQPKPARLLPANLGRLKAARATSRLGEGFRMPSGVRKPPKHEPAGLR
jgi:hypothetical protein